MNATEKFKFILERVENIVGKGEYAGDKHFLLFPQCFQQLSFPEVLKVGIVWERVKCVILHRLRNKFFQLNSLPDDKTLHWSKFKQIADDILECISNEK